MVECKQGDDPMSHRYLFAVDYGCGDGICVFAATAQNDPTSFSMRRARDPLISFDCPRRSLRLPPATIPKSSVAAGKDADARAWL